MKNEPKILYIDDEEINLQLFEINFEIKYNVLTAISGFVALDLLKDNEDVKIIISDMKMPQMNGVEFIKIAKSKYAQIVFCILTGYEITNDIQDLLDSGLILKYFKKPMDISDIDSTIEAVIKK
jgi:response regulator RpfG family c-di-GMP phosphodiesterase